MATLTEQLASLESALGRINQSALSTSDVYAKMQTQLADLVDLAKTTEHSFDGVNKAVTNASKAIEAGAAGFAGGSGVATNNFNTPSPVHGNGTTPGELAALVASTKNVEASQKLIDENSKQIKVYQQTIDTAKATMQPMLDKMESLAQRNSELTRQLSDVPGGPDTEAYEVLKKQIEANTQAATTEFQRSNQYAQLISGTQDNLNALVSANQQLQASIDAESETNQKATAEAKSARDKQEAIDQAARDKKLEEQNSAQEQILAENTKIQNAYQEALARDNGYENAEQMAYYKNLASKPGSAEYWEAKAKEWSEKKAQSEVGPTYTINLNIGGQSLQVTATTDPTSFLNALEAAKRSAL